MLLILLACAVGITAYVAFVRPASSRNVEQGAPEEKTTSRPHPNLSVSLNSDSDDNYGEFVDSMWAHPGCVAVSGVVLGRATSAGSSTCIVHSIVKSSEDRIYLNVLELGQRKTYAGDGRHTWINEEKIVDTSVFIALANGVESAVALAPDPYPLSLAEAFVKDRLATDAKRYVLVYRNKNDAFSWRVVSRISRQENVFSARCHYRWGERRTFNYDRVIDLIDPATGESIDLRVGKRRPSGRKKGGSRQRVSPP